MGLLGCQSNNQKKKKELREECADCEVEINLHRDVCNFSVIVEIPRREPGQNTAPPWYHWKINRPNKSDTIVGLGKIAVTDISFFSVFLLSGP